MARDFRTTVKARHALPVSERAMGMVQLVVSELVTSGEVTRMAEAAYHRHDRKAIARGAHRHDVRPTGISSGGRSGLGRRASS
jgi:hypothetical protein